MNLTPFYSTLSFSTIFFPFVFLLEYFSKKDLLYIYGLFGLLSVNIISEVLKYYVFSNNGRPEGAKDCNLFNNDGIQSGRPGMPSSHAAITTYFILTYIYLSRGRLTSYKNIVLLIYLYLVIYSRYYKKCHSLEQITGGTTLGMLSFSIFYMFTKSGLI